MRKKILIVAAAGTTLVTAGGLTIAFPSLRQTADNDEVVTLAQCPTAVQQTIVEKTSGGELLEIERTTDHGEVLFEVDVRRAGGVVEFDVAADGTFRGFEQDDDDRPDDDDGPGDDDGPDDDGDVQVTLADVPEPARTAIITHAGGLEITEIERSPEGNYEVDCGSKEFVVGAGGAYLGEEDEGD